MPAGIPSPARPDRICLDPIGLFHCPERYAYDLPRQGVLADGNHGVIRLFPGCHFEQALQDLDGFERIWLLFLFHGKTHWKPLIQPPRGNRKVGVFASRSPHRPNPIGLTCVRLEAIVNLELRVADHDLMDGTPILDIKPYLPYCDSFPEARSGWIEACDEPAWTVKLAPTAAAQVAWLEAEGVPGLRPFLLQQLAIRPTDGTRKRVVPDHAGEWRLAYRTWRIRFSASPAEHAIQVIGIVSGYRPEELADAGDRYGDKATHRAFRIQFADPAVP